MTIIYLRHISLPTGHVFYLEDLEKNNIKSDYSYNLNLDHKNYYLSEKGIFLGVLIDPSNFNAICTKLNITWKPILENCWNDTHFNNIVTLGIKNELEKITNNLESKFKYTSDIIKELKQDLNIKNEKIRNLELEVHYLKSQSEKKITIDYNAIKQKNKLLNNEFRRMFKLMKFNN